MKLETVDKIKLLRKNVTEIRNLFEKLIPKWLANREIYDKIRWGFKSGDSDGWYKSCEITVYFEAWAGTYGNSSTYKQIDLNGEIWKQHFMQYLNKNKGEIMLSIADSIEQEAIELKDKAELELQIELSKLQELGTLTD